MWDPAILPLSKYPRMLQNGLFMLLFKNTLVIVATGVKPKKQVKYLLLPAEFYKCYVPSFFFFFPINSFYGLSSAVLDIEVFHPKFRVWSVASENLNSTLAMLWYLKEFERDNTPLPNSQVFKVLKCRLFFLSGVYYSMSAAMML